MVGRLILVLLFALPATAQDAREESVRASASTTVQSEWAPVWEALARLELMPREAPEAVILRADLIQTAARRESAARKQSDRPKAFRARVLAAHLARLDGLEGRRVREPLVRIEFLSGEALLVARATHSGPTRTAAMVRALQEASSGDLPELGALSRATIEEDLGLLRIDLALELSRAWCRSAPTTENQLLLARVLRTANRLVEARAVLEALDPRVLPPPERADLHLERARHAAAQGDSEGELDALGAALAAGAKEAARALLERHLQRGEFDQALPLARAMLGQQTHAPWARRAWARALLSPPERRTELERRTP